MRGAASATVDLLHLPVKTAPQLLAAPVTCGAGDLAVDTQPGKPDYIAEGIEY
jgi:hypothetical protein